MKEFMECESCAGKPGSPILCKSCNHNRMLVEWLNTQLNFITVKLAMLVNGIKLMREEDGK